MLASKQIAFGKAAGGGGISAKSYVQDGLFSMWDGIENAGWGKHDPNATVWKDLVHGISIPLVAQCSFEDNAMRILATADNLSTAFVSIKPTSEEYATFKTAFKMDINVRTDYESTVEICLINRDTEANGLLLQLAENSGEGAIDRDATTGAIRKAYGPWPRYQKLSAKDGEVVSISQPSVFKFTDDTDYTVFTIYERGAELYTGEIEIAKGNYAFNRLPSRPMKPSVDLHASRLNAKQYNPTTGTSKDISFHFFRLYNRALTAEEIAHNYEIDKARFGL